MEVSREKIFLEGKSILCRRVWEWVVHVFDPLNTSKNHYINQLFSLGRGVNFSFTPKVGSAQAAIAPACIDGPNRLVVGPSTGRSVPSVNLL